MNRFSRLLAVAGVSGALAVGMAGVAQASPDHGSQQGANTVSKADNSSSKGDQRGSKDRKRERDRKREHAQSGADHGSGKGERHQYRHGSGH